MSSYDLYQQNILDYYKHPRNKGKVSNPDIKFRELNPLCGDEIEVTIKLEGNKIKQILFQGSGCAISQAAASMMTEHFEGKTIEEAKNFSKDEMLRMLGIPFSPARLRCALLGIRVMKEGVYAYLDRKNKDKADTHEIRDRLVKEELIF
ncbi:MAG TPA: SUF system NifU family Fe-S cluster assembly protein [Candidatus Nanoarchaeia archaeon]|nr:SUF system NifU family Fe-S cluster assembly protein [Candidatus Nanoarchaeia archaeon]